MGALLDTDFCDTQVAAFPHVASTRQIGQMTVLKRLGFEDLYLNLVGTFLVNHSLYSHLVLPIASNMRFSSTHPFLLFPSLN